MGRHVMEDAAIEGYRAGRLSPRQAASNPLRCPKCGSKRIDCVAGGLWGGIDKDRTDLLFAVFATSAAAGERSGTSRRLMCHPMKSGSGRLRRFGRFRRNEPTGRSLMTTRLWPNPRWSQRPLPQEFGLSDEDRMSLLHLDPGRRWPWLLSFGSLDEDSR
ncbi:hypothetical protein SBV1_1700022 [Verrucomicrobia bacterium]|nr:hypothetical protein SBV1_1700022 [Verrucomicrobiota bacterium]